MDCIFVSDLVQKSQIIEDIILSSITQKFTIEGLHA